MSVFLFTVYAYGAGNIIYFQKIQTRKKVNYGVLKLEISVSFNN